MTRPVCHLYQLYLFYDLAFFHAQFVFFYVIAPSYILFTLRHWAEVCIERNKWRDKCDGERCVAAWLVMLSLIR